MCTCMHVFCITKVYNVVCVKVAVQLTELIIFQAGLFLSTPEQHAPDLLPESLPDWEEIRRLDENELWIERTQVVTKEDHLFYFEIAKVLPLLHHCYPFGFGATERIG